MFAYIINDLFKDEPIFISMVSASDSLFSKSVLSDIEQQLLIAVDALIWYCSDSINDTSNMNNNDIDIQADPRPQMVSTKLLNLVDPDGDYWDITKPFCLQLVSDVLVVPLLNRSCA